MFDDFVETNEGTGDSISRYGVAILTSLFLLFFVTDCPRDHGCEWIEMVFLGGLVESHRKNGSLHQLVSNNIVYNAH